MSQTSRRQILSQAAASGLAIASLSAAAAEPPAGTKYKAVFQVSDNDSQRWNLALNNVKNAMAELASEGAQIELVAFGPGIVMLKGDSPFAQRIAELRQSGVQVRACEHTMTSMRLVAADMLPDIALVPSGVGELIKKQGQGYAYIRP